MASGPTTGGPITSSFNDAYIAELFEAYRRDPASVDESWRQFFEIAERLVGGSLAQPAPGAEGRTPDPGLLKKAAGAAALMQATRSYGHFAVQLDPLGTPPLGAPELTPEFHGITESDLDLIPGSALGFPHMATAADVMRRLRFRYSTTLGIEVTHLAEEEERKWFRQLLTAEEFTRPLTADEKRSVLTRLTEVDGLERFIGRAYPNAKRFSIEGTDALLPMLDATIDEGAAAGARHVVIAMAHRGRLNVLAHILGKPYDSIFDEFEGRHDDSGTGDVKYHLGAHGTRASASGAQVEITLVPNPSHLEMVNPVLEGMARALEREGTARRPETVVPVCVHGDAAFPGEGVVSETFNLSRLRGYEVGGTLHIIVNNQIGFTTDPADARSTHHASDIAKGFDVPIIHVNADNPEACIVAVRVGVAYRTRFGKDFLIDLVGYRRHGHNEGDEPAFTQPTMYDAIRSHPTSRELWGERLVRDGVLSADEVSAEERAVMERLAAIHAESTAGEAKPPTYDPLHPAVKLPPRPLETAVPAERLAALNAQMLAWPPSFSVHRRLARTLGRRRDALAPDGHVDWGLAEALALATVLTDGTPVRLTGQDAERGTFSHRHAVLHDAETGRSYIPLAHLEGGAPFEIYNSPLSETAVLGFEYGYSAAAPESLVLWEAQYGDFANVAQPIIDQFIVADRTKWGQDSDLALLLPHGYEGAGPEHSSARLERFLQLCAEDDMVVAVPTTAAQYFHILRRHVKTPSRRPLVLMMPKSLLRLDRAASRPAELTAGHFQSVINDPVAWPPGRREAVTRVVFCTGKLYYDLSAGEQPAHIALVRVEQLYPWPHDGVAWALDQYPAVDEVVWAQEEPKNMGAWTFVAPRLRAAAGNAIPVTYIGRPERASPAEGYLASHQREQARIVAEVLEGHKDRGRGGGQRGGGVRGRKSQGGSEAAISPPSAGATRTTTG
jgi:2-oxoglutarate dehydrogenase E1 component